MARLKNLLFWRKKKPSKPVMRFRGGKLIYVIHDNTGDPLQWEAAKQMMEVCRNSNGKQVNF